MAIVPTSPDTRAIGIASLLVAIAGGMMSNLLFLAAFRFRLDWLLEPHRLVAGGATSAEFLRWASVLDLISYYLASAVLAYVLWRQLRPRSPLIADLATISAVGYAFVGGAGAAALAMAGPALMHEYAVAAPAEHPVIAAQFTVLIEVVWRGIWQLFDAILLAGWWFGIGLLTRRHLRGLSSLSFVLAITAAVGAIVNLLGLELARDLSLGIVFTLWTSWWIWLLTMFLRSSSPSSP